MVQNIEINNNSQSTLVALDQQSVGALPNTHVYIFTDSTVINDEVLDKTFLQSIPMNTVSALLQIFFPRFNLINSEL